MTNYGELEEKLKSQLEEQRRQQRLGDPFQQAAPPVPDAPARTEPYPSGQPEPDAPELSEPDPPEADPSGQYNATPFDGEWYDRKKTQKLTIQNGLVTGYLLKDGECTQLFSTQGRMEDERFLDPAEEGQSFGSIYYRFRRQGDLLLGAHIGLMDARPPADTEFAQEGHEDAFSPVPVFMILSQVPAGAAGLHITDFSLSAEAQWSEKLFITAWEGFEAADELSFYFHTGSDGTKMVRGSVQSCDKTTCVPVPIREVRYALTEETEQALAALLLRPEVLQNNPCSIGGGMTRPTLRFRLSAHFASGEDIRIESDYGVVIGEETAGEMVRLLLDAGGDTP